MPKKRYAPARDKQGKVLKRARRRTFQIRKVRKGTILFGVLFVVEDFIAPKKDVYIMVGLFKIEFRLGRFYG